MIFVDASAMVALLCREPEMEAMARVIDQSNRLITSPIALHETAMALIRRKAYPSREAAREIAAMIAAGSMTVVDINADLWQLALAAFDRFGKGRHPAKLNMGDCFAYAVAKSHDAAILFVGDDFTKTDLRNALSAT